MPVAVNSPKTPVTAGSNGIAMATLPNICKMPGPPAPFVPTPLPNIGKSGNSPSGYSTTVTMGGDAVAIKGATFNSMGDVASQGTGGGLVSANVQGPTSFIGPGSLDVTVEGKAVQFLSDQMLNNCAAGGSPANAATMQGVVQGPAMALAGGTNPLKIDCKDYKDKKKPEGFDKCDLQEICEKCAHLNSLAGNTLDPKKQSTNQLIRRSPEDQIDARKLGNNTSARWLDGARAAFARGKTVDEVLPAEDFTHDCRKGTIGSGGAGLDTISADHGHEIQLNGDPGGPGNDGNIKWMGRAANEFMGRTMSLYNNPAKSPPPKPHTGVEPNCCTAAT